MLYAAGCATPPTETALPPPTEAVESPTNTEPPPTSTATPTEIPPTPTPTIPPPTATITPTQPTSTPWPTLAAPYPITYYLVFNTTKPPFDDVEVREAFAKAVDRQALVEALEATFNVEGILPATSLVPPEIWPDGRYLYQEIGLFPDPDQVAEAQEPWWDTSIQITFAAAEGNEIDSQMLIEQWAEQFGVEVELTFYESESYEAELDATTPHIYYYGWYADYASPYNFLADAVNAESQRTNWSNEDYAQLVEAALSAGDANRSSSLYEEAERMLTEEEVVLVPLYHFVYYP